MDELSNWYVRRSRRRFWKSEDDADKAAAYGTLYECLTTLSTLLAPFTPYVAEEMYRNLVAAGGGKRRNRCTWRLGRRRRRRWWTPNGRGRCGWCSAWPPWGGRPRSKAGVKVRQLLPAVMVGCGRRGASGRGALRAHAAGGAEREGDWVPGGGLGRGVGALVEYVIKPNLPVLGPRLGKAVGPLRRAMQELDGPVAAGIARAAEAGETIEIAGVELAPGDLLIEMREREGAATAQDALYTVAVTTALTAELEQEGRARELVHRLQTLRRKAGFEIADRITVWISGDAPALSAAMAAHERHIRGETLARALHMSAPPADATTSVETIDGETVTLGVGRG